MKNTIAALSIATFTLIGAVNAAEDAPKEQTTTEATATATDPTTEQTESKDTK
jgi:hypothetical protein